MLVVVFCFVFFLDKQLYLNVHFVSGSDNRKKKTVMIGISCQAIMYLSN